MKSGEICRRMTFQYGDNYMSHMEVYGRVEIRRRVDGSGCVVCSERPSNVIRVQVKGPIDQRSGTTEESALMKPNTKTASFI